jgi:glycerol uptake facilitator-like aquaporin
MTTIKRSASSPATPQSLSTADTALGSAETASENLLLAGAAECIGTLLLVLVGTAVATAAVLSKATAGPAYDSLAVLLSFGLILIPIAGSLGQISGAHVNPAVTLGLAVAGKFA